MQGLAVAPSPAPALHQAQQGLDASGPAPGPQAWVLARCNPLGDVFLQGISLAGPWPAAAGAEWACIDPPASCLVKGSLVSAQLLQVNPGARPAFLDPCGFVCQPARHHAGWLLVWPCCMHIHTSSCRVPEACLWMPAERAARGGALQAEEQLSPAAPAARPWQAEPHPGPCHTPWHPGPQAWQVALPYNWYSCLQNCSIWVTLLPLLRTQHEPAASTAKACLSGPALGAAAAGLLVQGAPRAADRWLARRRALSAAEAGAAGPFVMSAHWGWLQAWCEHAPQLARRGTSSPPDADDWELLATLQVRVALALQPPKKAVNQLCMPWAIVMIGITKAKGHVAAAAALHPAAG